MYSEQFFIEGLGCASYIIGCESNGVAAVIDPDRDVRKYLQAAEARGLKITHIIETHLHADHVSGNLELADRTGAQIYLHEQAAAEFEHTALKHGDTLWLGNIQIMVRHTPGHTPESITLLVADTTRGEQPWMALTGDTLFVGDIGRPDLVGADAAAELAGKMHSSLNEQLLPLPDGLLVYPGHGAGSLCGKSIGAMRSTTLGYERQFNVALQPRPRDEFILFATENLPEQPGNHRRIKALNRKGASIIGSIIPKALSVQAAIPYFQSGAALLDLRSKAQFVEKHVPGSVHMELDAQISNKVGFILHPEMPIVLLLADPADYESVFYSLARVGYEKVAGYLENGLDEWERMGLPLTSGDIKDITPRELNELIQSSNGDRPVILDVRETWEFRKGHIPGAVHIPLGELARRTSELDPKKPVAVICATGNRSQSAAALLGQKKFETIYNVLNGTMGWANQRLPIER
jgi:glyoxylase-like metal-dependent hydrolase (beta-lactamase superfamily II)/rhodanese-related sulfurtransferase